MIGCAVFGEKERPAPIIIKEYIPYPQHHCHSNYNLSASNTSSNTSSKEQVNAFNVRSMSQDLGTGWGETKRSEVTSVEFDKESNPAAVYEIFYNTREQLERLAWTSERKPSTLRRKHSRASIAGHQLKIKK